MAGSVQVRCQVLSEVVEEVLAENNLQGSDIAWLVPHQAISASWKPLQRNSVWVWAMWCHCCASRKHFSCIDPVGAGRSGARRAHQTRAEYLLEAVVGGSLGAPY